MAYAFGAPVLFQCSNIIYLIGAAWLPLGVHAVDQWVRLGRRWGLLELALVLSMQLLGGDPQAAYLLGMASIGYALGLGWSRARATSRKTRWHERGSGRPRLRLAVVGDRSGGLLRRDAGAGSVAARRSEALASRLPPLGWMVWMPLGVCPGLGTSWTWASCAVVATRLAFSRWLSPASVWPRRLPCRPLSRRLSSCRSSSSSS